jgi:hypothetical protein
MGDLIKITRTVTLVTFEEKGTYFDGSEIAKYPWSDDRITRYIHQMDLNDHLEKFGEDLESVRDYEPKISERAWGEPYGDFSVVVQTERPEPLSAEVAYLIHDANS